MSVLAARRVLTAQGILEPGWVRVEGQRVAALGAGPPPDATVTAHADWLVPGFTDIHMHGGGGYDVTTSADELRGAVAFHRAHGTTSTLISLVTASIDDLCAQLSRIAELARTDPGVLGAHLEGPVLSTVRCGAQDPRHMIPPDRAALARLLTAAGGHLRSTTIAPELPGAGELIDDLLEAGVVVAVGHTNATYDQARRAFDRGATLATHLFNAMPPLHHREPGPVGAALDAGVHCEIINDGVHNHPAVTRLVAGRRAERLVLVTDAISAAGAADGDYLLGGQSVRVEHGQARLRSTGSLAGSTLTMDQAVRRAIGPVQLEPVTAFRAASANPATALGLGESHGTIAVGRRADLVALDNELRPVQVLCGGPPA